MSVSSSFSPTTYSAVPLGACQLNGMHPSPLIPYLMPLHRRYQPRRKKERTIPVERLPDVTFEARKRRRFHPMPRGSDEIITASVQQISMCCDYERYTAPNLCYVSMLFGWRSFVLLQTITWFGLLHRSTSKFDCAPSMVRSKKYSKLSAYAAIITRRDTMPVVSTPYCSNMVGVWRPRLLSELLVGGDYTLAMVVAERAGPHEHCRRALSGGIASAGKSDTSRSCS
ncbi:uncharacterized protein H6S33_010840 [Morchella sextelata]|uniref:uncharacterized protein n=1 Tax=Morchella sextelata TaxID=1174677 RepID=UPI001D03874C|nr:uncharacterized protein H6S33_010840 [Morchella sextelata]KAH0611575.1 hypothetical protein H6S33_010840 [Morchella sextelata]